MISTQPKPPVAAKEPRQIVFQDDVRNDDYYWLRERENPAVRAYLDAENDYLQAVMAHTKPLQARLYQEMRARIQEEDSSVPEQIDRYYYYRREEEGKQYPIFCRKAGSLNAAEEVLLDQNELAEGHDFCDLGIYRISPNHQLLAFSVDYDGNERFLLQVKDLKTGQVLPDAIPDTFYSVEWAADNQTLFYNKQDAAWRPYQLYRHQLGTDPAKDPLVYHEIDDSYWLQLYKSKDDHYLFLSMQSSTTTEIHFIPAAQPEAMPLLIHPREHEMEYRVEHHPTLRGGCFLITTNWEAENFRVMTAPVDTPGKANWQELFPYRPAVKVDSVEPFVNHLVIHEREAGLRQLHIYPLGTEESHAVQFPESVYTYHRHRNPEFATGLYRFTYTSFTTPETVYDYNLNDRSREQKKQQPVLGYDAEQYVAERIFATARDGTQIPISLVRHKETPTDQPVPLLLHGYGAYGVCSDPEFSSSRISLLDRGMVYASAQIRGGGEMGRHWYLNGRIKHKMNTFTDFVDCAQHLVNIGYTSPEQFAITGRSAGGLLMGAVLNLRPDLFKVVVAGVPFVDVINTIIDESIPLTVIEWEEWGNPHKPDEYAYMRAYSPYDNLVATAYPHILATAGLNDSRVQYWEPAKWVAKLRTVKTDENHLLLKTNMGAGHAGSSGRFDYLKETAFEYAFILDALGLV